MRPGYSALSRIQSRSQAPQTLPKWRFYPILRYSLHILMENSTCETRITKLGISATGIPILFVIWKLLFVICNLLFITLLIRRIETDVYAVVSPILLTVKSRKQHKTFRFTCTQLNQK
ncbi:hypothetical protein KsCSTR_32910 [Candidatus Kuenenia stuttgartiensis]|uniref:Uncharacterized protein n=1 Tax=Kuenenia stuttgartiensis TaxID=174633 RepID=Q1Q4J4_KUEST|nr:hypothetical protein KsCSTR_32910 [Candidatus Kuenenia stuttgartiensis]CAJ74938.1 unknown protein [Candidatus Kuenenia stuttgartiensis]